MMTFDSPYMISYFFHYNYVYILYRFRDTSIIAYFLKFKAVM